MKKIQNPIYTISAMLLVLLVTHFIKAQENKDTQSSLLDRSVRLSRYQSFSVSGGTNGGQVETLALQADGKLLAGGFFTNAGNASCNYIARFNPTGSVDTTFNPNLGSSVNSYVKKIIVLNNDKILVGGKFNINSSGGNLVRFNSNGSIDPSFASFSGRGYVNAMEMRPDGKVMVAGSITFDGLNYLTLFQLNSDGSRDMSFISPLGDEATITSIAIQPDSKVIVGGFFTIYGQGGYQINNLVRLNTDGSIDTSFNHGGSGPDSSVLSISLQSDGKILIGGNFNYFNFQIRRSLVRLFDNGQVDASFVSINTDCLVHSILILPNGKILIGGAGSFFPAASEPLNYLALLDQNGGFISLFGQLFNYNGHSNSVKAILFDNQRTVILGGRFGDFSGSEAANLGTLYFPSKFFGKILR